MCLYGWKKSPDANRLTKWVWGGTNELRNWVPHDNFTPQNGYLYAVFDQATYNVLKSIKSNAELSENAKKDLIALVTIRFHIYFGRDATKFSRWPSHHNHPASPFDFFMCEERENGKIHYVVYFTEDDFTQYYRALESVMIKTSRACPCVPNTWNIVNGDKVFLAVKASSVNTDMYAHICVKLCSNVADGIGTARPTPQKPTPSRRRQSTRIEHDAWRYAKSDH